MPEEMLSDGGAVSAAGPDAALYRALFEAAGDSIILCNGQGRAVDCNAAALELLRCTRETLIGSSPVDWSPTLQPDGRSSEDAAAEVFANVFAGRTARFEWVNCRRDGSFVDVDVTVRMLPGWQPPLVVVISRNIDAAKTLERELRLSEEKFATAFRDSPDAMVFAEIETGLIREINRGFTAAFGYTEADCLGRTTLDIGLWADARQRDETVRLMREQGRLHNREVDFRTKHGELRTVLGSSTRIDVNGKPYWLVQFRDITERKAMECELHDLNARLDQRVAERTADLERALRELEAFSYSVSHDLRAPLRAINGYASIVADGEREALSADGRHMLGRIAQNATRLGELIDDILEYARVGRQAADFRRVDLPALAAHVGAELQSVYPQTVLRIGELPTVTGDATMLREIFQNLIDNACKFSAACPAPLVEIGCAETDGQRVFHVRDNGVGFDMRYAAKLFGMFQRMHGADGYAGTGVGLAIVKRLVERHGGRIWATSEPQQGTTFSFTLAAVA